MRERFFPSMKSQPRKLPPLSTASTSTSTCEGVKGACEGVRDEGARA